MLIDILLILVYSEDNECFIAEALGKVNNTQLNIALICAHTQVYTYIVDYLPWQEARPWF